MKAYLNLERVFWAVILSATFGVSIQSKADRLASWGVNFSLVVIPTIAAARCGGFSAQECNAGS